jgi:hypothetical protein
MKLIQLLLLCFICTTVRAQSIERKIVNTTGTRYNSTGVSLKISIGEPIVGRFENATITAVDTTISTILSQGFFTGLIRKTVPVSAVPPVVVPVDTVLQLPPAGYSIYPNPVKDVLFIKGNLVFIDKIQFIDITGHRLFTLTPGPGGAVPVHTLPPGSYITQLTNKSGDVLNVFKIIKL